MSGERFPEGYEPLYDTGHRTDDSDRRPLSHFNDEDIKRLYNQTRYGIRGGQIKYFQQDDDDSNDITGTLPDRYFEPGDGGIYSRRRGGGDAPRQWGDVADQLPFGMAQSDDQIYKMFDAVTDEFLARELERGAPDDPVDPVDPVEPDDPDDPGDGGGGDEVAEVRRGMNFLLSNALNDMYPDETSGVRNWAIENYGFFAPENREANRFFQGQNYLGPENPVATNPFTSYVNQDNEFDEVPDDAVDGYGQYTQNMAFSAARFLQDLKDQFGIG